MSSCYYHHYVLTLTAIKKVIPWYHHHQPWKLEILRVTNNYILILKIRSHAKPGNNKIVISGPEKNNIINNKNHGNS